MFLQDTNILPDQSTVQGASVIKNDTADASSEINGYLLTSGNEVKNSYKYINFINSTLSRISKLSAQMEQMSKYSALFTFQPSLILLITCFVKGEPFFESRVL